MDRTLKGKTLSAMFRPQHRFPFPCFLFFSLIFLLLFHPSRADVGTAAYYTPPYLPTACYGNDLSQFPANNLFAAAGNGIWDNGASCGREYLVRCLSATEADACIADQTIQVMIVDYAPSSPSSTIVLSYNAFSMIANSSAKAINIEFQQV